MYESFLHDSNNDEDALSDFKDKSNKSDEGASDPKMRAVATRGGITGGTNNYNTTCKLLKLS